MSQRQAGREINGKLFKGSIVDAYNRLSQPSIPTKIEQILTQPSVKEGFNVSSQRFVYNVQRLPGPGDYSYTNLKNPSVSKRGYLMTQSSRFKKDEYKTHVPGPGTYNSKQKKPRSMTISGRTRSNQKILEVPSPCHYNPSLPGSSRETTSVFKSNTRRMKEPQSESPGPWKYNPKKPKSSREVTTPFVIHSNRKREKIDLYDPHAKPKEVVTPGPGDYQKERNSKENKASFMFSSTSDVDRFGKSVRKRVREIKPGPGDYNVVKDGQKSMVTGAVFLSESKRAIMNPLKKPPGPAFYSPLPVPKRKSFHYKVNNTWL